MGKSIFCALPISDIAKADLARRMGDPSRHYHTVDHLELLWSRHRKYGEMAEVHDASIDRLIAFAVAYHDVVYVGGAADNEARSADLWLEVGAELKDLEEIDRLWVADTIRATANHLEAPLPDMNDARQRARQWVLDLDLTPLGEAAAIFDRNMELLVAELPHISPNEQHAGLIAAIRRFAAARPLYRSPAIANVFDARAHYNFQRHLGKVVDVFHTNPNK